MICSGETGAGTGTCPKSLSQSSEEPGLLTPTSFYFWDHIWALESSQSIQDFKFYLGHLFT